MVKNQSYCFWEMILYWNLLHFGTSHIGLDFLLGVTTTSFKGIGWIGCLDHYLIRQQCQTWEHQTQLAIFLKYSWLTHPPQSVGSGSKNFHFKEVFGGSWFYWSKEQTLRNTNVVKRMRRTRSEFIDLSLSSYTIP